MGRREDFHDSYKPQLNVHLYNGVLLVLKFLLGLLWIRRSKLLQTNLTIRTSGIMTIEESPSTATKDMYFLTAKSILYYSITISTQNTKHLSSYSHEPVFVLLSALYFNKSFNHFNNLVRVVLMLSQFSK